jgi:parallel beta-helix repeat protein
MSSPTTKTEAKLKDLAKNKSIGTNLTVLIAALVFWLGVPSANAADSYYYTAPVADFATTAYPWTAVSGCSLSFTPGSTSENWLVIATGQVRSTNTSDPQEAHVRLRVGGTVEGEGGVQNSPADAESGFFMMHRITGTTALQNIDVQAQDPFNNLSTTTVEQCSITAFRIPANADFQWTDVDGASGNCLDTPDTTILTHAFTPSSAGDYLFINSFVHIENPGGATNKAWITYPSAVEAPDFNTENAWGIARDARQSLVSMRKETLGASLQTLTFTCDGSTSNSTMLWAKSAAFRVDAFGAAYHGENLTEVTGVTSSTWTTHTSVTQTAPSVSSEFIMLGTISGCTNSTASGPQHGLQFREDSTVQGDSVWGITRDCTYNEAFHNSFQWVEPYTTASAKTWDNQYQSTDGITEARFAESAIHVLQFPSTTIGDGTSPGDTCVGQSSTNNAVDAFTLATDTGTDTVTALTVTFTGTDVNDVAASGVKIYEDNGGTPNEWDATDTLIDTASFSGNTASFTGLSISVNTTATQYLVTYDIAAGATASNTLQGAITAATVSNTLVNNDTNDATLTVALTTITFQKGDGKGTASETDDAWLDADTPAANHGSDEALEIDETGIEFHTVIKFPNIFGGGANQIPLGSSICSGTSLTVEVFDSGDDPDVYQLIESWIEDQVSWSNRVTGTAWSNAGADGTSSRKSTAEGSLPCGSTGAQSVGVTTSVQNWSDGEANEGWLLEDTASGGVRLRSSEYTTTPSERPKLTVYYIPPPATTTIGDGTSPGNKDVARGSTNNAVDAFTLATDTGTDTVTALTVTFSGTDVNDVAASGVKIYEDNGGTPNEWDASDTPIATASFSGNDASFTGLNILVNTTATQYLVTYDIAAGATASNTLQGAITAATVTNTLVNNDTTDATLTVSPTTYYVRKDGNDSNSGTSNTPGGAWLTIQKAANTMLAGDTVLVQAGTYYEMVQPANSGTSGNPITYKAEGTVVIDGDDTRARAFELIDDSYIVIDGFEITNVYNDGGSGGSIRLDGASDYVTIRNNIIRDTGRDGIYLTGTSDNSLVENNLIYNIDDDGITPAGSGNHTLRNNTIYNCGGWALENAATTGNLYENNIFWHDAIDDTTVATYNYNDYNGTLSGTGNINSDPLFVNAAGADFHLSHTATGQGSDSPCKDAGSDTAANLGLDTRTTRTDNVTDTGTVDMGFHYLPPTTTIEDGTSPGDKSVARSSTNNAVDAFTLATDTGTDTVTALTVTFTGSDVNDVAASGVKIYEDNGGTPNEWDATDTLIDTASFSGSTASFTGLNILVNTTATQYLVTYDIAAGATFSNTLQGAITAATVSNTLVNNDTTDATLTVSAATTIGDGTSPGNKDVAQSSTNNAVDAFTLATDTGTDTVTALTVTFSGTDVNDVAASGVKIYEDNGATANEWDATDTLIDTASFSGSAANFTGLTISVNTTATQYLVTYDIAAGATISNTLQGAITAATVSNILVNNDTNDATLTVSATTTIEDGTSPGDKSVAKSSTNNAVDAFTLATDTGTDTVTALTVTFTGTDVNDVAASGVKIYEDNGGTPNEWDASDTPIATASFSGNDASFTGLNILVNTTATQYLVTYDIAAGATLSNTLQGAITAATVSNILVNNDTIDATLTISSNAPDLTQIHYRWRNDNGAETTSSGFTGDETDGALTVTNPDTVVNDYTYLTGNVISGATSIDVNDATNFSGGDEILIIQMQDSGSYTPGTYEFKTIQSKAGNTLTLTSGLDNAYGSGTFDQANASATQVVRVPQYTTVTVNNGASITANAWDGYTGGIVVFRASETLDVDGTIDVVGKGFRGGDGGTTGSGTAGAGQNGESYDGKVGSGGDDTNQGAGGGTAGTSGGGAGAGYDGAAVVATATAAVAAAEVVTAPLEARAVPAETAQPQRMTPLPVVAAPEKTIRLAVPAALSTLTAADHTGVQKHQ